MCNSKAIRIGVNAATGAQVVPPFVPRRGHVDDVAGGAAWKFSFAILPPHHGHLWRPTGPLVGNHGESWYSQMGFCKLCTALRHVLIPFVPTSSGSNCMHL